jgi:hypothetical protein
MMDHERRKDEDRLSVASDTAPREQEAGARAAAQHAGSAAVKAMLSPDAVRVANNFYAAFASRDTAAMRSFYGAGVHFHDPLFGNLRGIEQVMLMWTSIMPKADPFRIAPGPASTPTMRSDGAWEVRVHWDAHYGLGKARITNHSDTTLAIKDGRIIDQHDVWNLAAWTAQALPSHLGGHVVTDVLLQAAAHSYIVVVDMIRRLHHSES